MRYILAILGTVLLGALGSGLWDAIFKPIFPWIGELLLDFATLGIKALRDSIYLEIAKGIYERAALSTLIILYAAVTAAYLFLLVGALWIYRRAEAAPAKSRIFDGLRSHKGRKNFARIVSLAASVVIGYAIVETARTVYIIRAAAHIEQFQRVVAPLLTEAERLQLSSRVAQIASREDYVEIISKLETLAKKNNV